MHCWTSRSWSWTLRHGSWCSYHLQAQHLAGDSTWTGKRMEHQCGRHPCSFPQWCSCTSATLLQAGERRDPFSAPPATGRGGQGSVWFEHQPKVMVDEAIQIPFGVEGPWKPGELCFGRPRVGAGSEGRDLNGKATPSSTLDALTCAPRKRFSSLKLTMWRAAWTRSQLRAMRTVRFHESK